MVPYIDQKDLEYHIHASTMHYLNPIKQQSKLEHVFGTKVGVQVDKNGERSRDVYESMWFEQNRGVNRGKESVGEKER